MLGPRTLRLFDALPHHPFRRDLAVRSGFPAAQLSLLGRAGLLRSPVRGVLVRHDAPDDVATRAAAVRLVLPDGAAICRITAAWLYGIDARPPGTHTAEPPVECAVPLGTAPLRRPEIRCYVTDLVGEDIVEHAGLPCLSPDRTAIDLARWSMPGMGLSTLDAMARAGLVDPGQILTQVERWRGDRFVDQARRLIRLCDPLAESAGESWLRLRFHDAGFPPPQVQIRLVDADGVERRRIDLGYVHKKYGIEYDGEQYHCGREAEQADRLRREELQARWGWTVVGVGKNLVLGPSMNLERAVGEVLGMEPVIRCRRW